MPLIISGAIKQCTVNRTEQMEQRASDSEDVIRANVCMYEMKYASALDSVCDLPNS